MFHGEQEILENYFQPGVSILRGTELEERENLGERKSVLNRVVDEIAEFLIYNWRK